MSLIAERFLGVSLDYLGHIEHDDTVGSLLKALDDMGLTNDTIVVYSSDNGPHMNTWPDGAMTWFRSEKNTNWEGAFRVPCLVRWPGVIKPGTVTNELMIVLMSTLFSSAMSAIFHTCRSAKKRMRRQKPTRLPYS